MAEATTGVKQAANKLVDSIKGLGTDAGAAFRTAGDALKGGSGTTGKILMKPVEWGVSVARWPVSAARFAFRKAPVLSVIATVAGGVYAVRSFFRNNAEQRTQEELSVPVSVQVPVSQPSYKNSVSPEETVAMNAQMKQTGIAGHAANVEAARAQMPPVEKTAAL